MRCLNAREGLGFYWLIASFATALLLIFLRDPSLFTRPQFWAEDGSFWYAQAYNGGWLHSLTIPDGGYLNTLQRLSAGLALVVPFRWAPLPMVLVGLLAQALPVPILLSVRCRKWTSLPLRILLAAVYIAIPNAREIHVVCTNSHFHLALAELLLAFSAAPRSLAGRAFDVFIFLLGSVCGPFGLLLLPFVIAFWWIRRQPWSLLICGLLLGGAIAQLMFLRHIAEARSARPLGASVPMFIRLLGGNVFLGSLRGSTPYGLRQPLFISLMAFIIGLAICLYCARFASPEIRLFFLYCFVLFAAELRTPLVPPSSTTPRWVTILQQPSIRYWFFPSLAFLFAVLWCVVYARSRTVRLAAIALALLLCQGIYRDWRIPALEDMHFPQTAAEFKAAKPGTHFLISLNPPPMTMSITKK